MSRVLPSALERYSFSPPSSTSAAAHCPSKFTTNSDFDTCIFNIYWFQISLRECLSLVQHRRRVLQQVRILPYLAFPETHVRDCADMETRKKAVMESVKSELALANAQELMNVRIPVSCFSLVHE